MNMENYSLLASNAANQANKTSKLSPTNVKAKFDAQGADLVDDQKQMIDLDEEGNYNDKYLRTTNEKKK
jgi:hypothetical protein